MADRLLLTFVYTDLTHRYADAVDRGDGSAVAALFGSPGTWDGREFRLPVISGHEALAAHFEVSEPTGSVHLVSNHLVVDAAGQPRATSYAHVVQPRADGVRQLVVRYDDLMIDDDGEWKFAERVLRRAISF